MDTSNTIKIFGTEYAVRKTFDILDYIGGVYGFDVLDNSNSFLFHINGEYEALVESEIRWRIYRYIS